MKDAFVLAAISSNGIDFDGGVVNVTAASMALSGVGVAGKLPTLAPFDVLVRVHCVLGHATLNTVLATIAFATSLPKGFITREAIKQYIAAKCGICESAKMRRRTFRIDLSGISDKTIPEIGMPYVFDTLGLRTPSAQWGFINITRFNDRNPKGIKRSYGHVSMEATAFEALILTMRAYVRPHTGEIHVMKKDGHPSHRSHLIQDLFVDSSMNNHESPPYVHGTRRSTLKTHFNSQYRLLWRRLLVVVTVRNTSTRRSYMWSKLRIAASTWMAMVNHVNSVLPGAV